VQVAFDSAGALATTHESQGSDMGLFAGLLGWEADHERLVDSPRVIRENGTELSVQINDYSDSHPNIYRLTIKRAGNSHQLTAASEGGGMIDVTEIDGAEVSIEGDFYETLVFVDSGASDLARDLDQVVNADEIRVCRGNRAQFVEVKAQEFLSSNQLNNLTNKHLITDVKFLSPVLPVLSRKDISVPFSTSREMLEYNRKKELSLWELAVDYESKRGNISSDAVFARMLSTAQIMRDSIQTGLSGTDYEDRILGCQSNSFKKMMERNALLDGGILNRVILYVTAMMEVKSSMGIIVAAPTAGACGTLPGSCLGAADEIGLSEMDVTKALLAAGMIGVFICSQSTFAAEVAGCQAECGAASGMAAASLVTLAGGSTSQALGASAMALQNVMGMVCDPVANRVEVPCLGKNVMAAANALSCANMALADFDPVVPLDEVITAMDDVGRSLPCELRCTARGGLSLTPASKAISEYLRANLEDRQDQHHDRS
jgi:L-serine dehydratase